MPSINQLVSELRQAVATAGVIDPVRPNVSELLPEVATLVCRAAADPRHPIRADIEALREMRELKALPKHTFFRPRLGAFDDDLRPHWRVTFLMNLAAFHAPSCSSLAELLLLTTPEMRELAAPPVEGDDQWTPAEFARRLRDALTLLITPESTLPFVLRGDVLTFGGKATKLGRDQAKLLRLLADAIGRPVMNDVIRRQVTHPKKTCSRLRATLQRINVPVVIATLSTGGYVLQVS